MHFARLVWMIDGHDQRLALSAACRFHPNPQIAAPLRPFRTQLPAEAKPPPATLVRLRN